MDNAALASLLNEIAVLLEMKGENVYRVRAYQRAAETVASLGEPASRLRERGALVGQPGIGSGIAETIEQALDGRPIPLLDELHRSFPPGVVTLLRVNGVGPKLAARVYQAFGVQSIDELEAVARDGRLAGLERVGPKSAANILRNIEALRSRGSRLPIAAAIPVVEGIMAALRTAPNLRNLTPAGSYRRFQETVGDLDLIGTSDRPDDVMDLLVGLPVVREVVAHGKTKTSVVVDPGIQLDLRLVADEDFGSLLQHFTGNQQHNIQLREYAVARGMKVSEYGIADAGSGQVHHFAREEDVYAHLGLQYMPPEIRQGLGEIEIAARHAIPRLIELGDVRGDLHMHTTESDGHNTLEEMVAAARAHGYDYIAIADHSAGRGVAGGLSVERLRAQMAAIRALNARLDGITVLAASEVDIRADGTLDYPDEVLAELDLVVASIHSAMAQDETTMTRRLLAAIENPHVDIIGHLSARLIGQREPVQFDRGAVFSAAARTRTALEVNAHPNRLDLKDSDVRLAREAGCLLTIDTDAHSIADLDLMICGIKTARRGWAVAGDVLNTRPLAELRAWLDRPHGA
ncbi:MAG TPA: DNA polymerase/3'-5' exonuclease PolX [Chloroflexota bacterium]|nr:DNA polymerase/3'-5' exonuclease PolX [Chloroflexota bacterium]